LLFKTVTQSEYAVYHFCPKSGGIQKILKIADGQIFKRLISDGIYDIFIYYIYIHHIYMHWKCTEKIEKYAAKVFFSIL
jgi:hypothetical protein